MRASLRTLSVGRAPVVLAALAAVILLPIRLAAQEVRAIDPRNEVFVNSEIETYLRLLQVSGVVPLYPWSVRSFSPREVDRLTRVDSIHPWMGRFALEATDMRVPRLRLIRPGAKLVFNSAFPYGFNNGPVWAGRGVTTAVQAGASARWGPLSIAIAPLAFRAENASFELAPQRQEAVQEFADPWRPHDIDLPQRFGDHAYARIDPGQSSVRLDLPGVALGVSAANQHWGPATEHPILLGNNAPGFLHGFVGTSEPLNVWIGHVHARGVWGRLEQSEYSAHVGHGSRRLMSGFLGVFLPRGVPGLELGLARFYHEAWPRGGVSLRDLLKPFEGFLKEGLVDPSDEDFGDDPDNQLASVFARWVFPRAGFEIYGEYGREDHNWDRRDLYLHPDHNSGYVLGLGKVWRLGGNRLVAVRGELLNTAEGHIKQVRLQSPFYVHTLQRQGHTHRGQILGSGAGYGGGGSLIAGDYVHPGGRITGYWRRELRQEVGQYWWDGGLFPEGLDVVYGYGAEVVYFRGRFDLDFGLGALHNLNRNFAADRFNLNAAIGARVAF